MNHISNDKEYLDIIKNILKNKKFNQIKKCKHHGLTRYEHSLRVSYYSYLVTKKLKLNYIETARAGLLHDFFITDELKGIEKRLRLFLHPYKSLINSNHYFKLTKLEKDIILNHMFPVLPHKIPKHLESWIVSLVDKIAALYEFSFSYGKIFLYKYSQIYFLLVLFRI